MGNGSIGRIAINVIVILVLFIFVLNYSVVDETRVNDQLKCIAGDRICSEWVDTKTNVHYWYTQRGGLMLRVNEDGTPYTE